MKNLLRHALLSAGLVICVPAYAHGKLVSSTPANDAVLAQAPASIELRFNEAVEVAFTTIALTGPVNADRLTTTSDGDRSKVIAPLPALTAGTYHVKWTTVGHDGHHVSGTLVFSVK